jgi:hypothetical protein
MLGPDDHGHTGRLWCDPCVGHGVMLEQAIHRCANPVSSGNGIAPDPLREAALALLNWYDTTHGNEFGHDHHCPVPWDDNPHTQTPDDRCTCGWSAFLRADDKRAALAAPALRSAVVGPPITGAALVERIREDRLTSTPAPDPLREALYTAKEVREHGERIARAYKALLAATAQPAPDPLRAALVRIVEDWDGTYDADVRMRAIEEDIDLARAVLTPSCCELACYEDPGCRCDGCAPTPDPEEDDHDPRSDPRCNAGDGDPERGRRLAEGEVTCIEEARK